MNRWRNLLSYWLLFCVGCATEPTQSTMRMTAELDIFSGRPNPTWTLTTDESTRMAALLTNLPPANPAPADPGLGYRGVVLQNPEPTPELPARIRVYRGVVLLGDDPAQRFNDVHDVEHQLLKQASVQGYAALVDSL